MGCCWRVCVGGGGVRVWFLCAQQVFSPRRGPGDALATSREGSGCRAGLRVTGGAAPRGIRPEGEGPGDGRPAEPSRGDVNGPGS